MVLLVISPLIPFQIGYVIIFILKYSLNKLNQIINLNIFIFNNLSLYLHSFERFFQLTTLSKSLNSR